MSRTKMDVLTGMTVAERRTIFQDLVSEQDHQPRLNKESVRNAKIRIAQKHEITIDTLQKIEDEGIRKDWPLQVESCA